MSAAPFWTAHHVRWAHGWTTLAEDTRGDHHVAVAWSAKGHARWCARGARGQCAYLTWPWVARDEQTIVIAEPSAIEPAEIANGFLLPVALATIESLPWREEVTKLLVAVNGGAAD